MATTYLQSESVDIFPSAWRTEKADGKFTSENNLTGIIRSICDKDSFVINDDGTEFIIHGYYFKVNSLPNITPLFAFISLDSANMIVPLSGSGAYSELDINNLFVGLGFDTSAPLNTTTYSLQIKDSSGNIPDESRGKFDTNSIIFTDESSYSSLTDIINNKQDKIDSEHKLSYELISNSNNIIPDVATHAISSDSATEDSEGNVIATYYQQASTAVTHAENTPLNTNGNKLIKVSANGLATESTYNDATGYPVKIVNGAIVPFTSQETIPGKISSAANADLASNSTVASKLGTDTVGSINQLIYLNNGVATPGISIMVNTQLPVSTNYEVGSVWLVPEEIEV